MSTTAPAREANAQEVSNHPVPGCSVQIATERCSWAGVGCASSWTSPTYSWGMKRQTRSSAGGGKQSIDSSIAKPRSRSASPKASRISAKKTFCPLDDTRQIRGWPDIGTG